MMEIIKTRNRIIKTMGNQLGPPVVILIVRVTFNASKNVGQSDCLLHIKARLVY